MSDDKKDKKILDSDADGLLDYEEESLGTDPHSKDTDKDELDDYEEVNVYHTDPLNPDTDADGMTDGAEVKAGRNPKGSGSLKNLFIPNQHNSYRPHILHPKRLAFHAVSAIAIKVIMVAFALSFPVQAWLSPDVLYQQARKIIQLTNNIRQELGIAPVTENQVLNQAALNKAQDMLIDQYFAHVSPDNKALRHFLYDLNYNFKVAGENLAIGFSEADSIMAAWKKSPTHYSNLIDPDFTEIGVGVVSGDYNAYETTLTAQYFGNPYVKVEPIPEPIEIVTPEIKEIKEKIQDYNHKVEQVVIDLELVVEDTPAPKVQDDLVLAEKEVEEVTIDITAPILDQTKTSILVNQPGNSDNIVLKAVAYLSEDTDEAFVSFADHQIILNQDYNQVAKWTGHKIIYGVDYDSLFNPIVLATLTAVDKSGNILVQDISWQDIRPVLGSTISQYSFLKQSNSKSVAPLFNIGDIYYKIMLIIAVLALILNIFIQIRRQHTRTIASTLGLIALLTFLTIF